jgi:hypothetical protein
MGDALVTCLPRVTSNNDLNHQVKGIAMSARSASIFITMSLFLLAGCGPRFEVHDYTSAQVSVHPTDDDAPGRTLTGPQLAAVTQWIKTRNDWSGMSVNVPDHPSLQFRMQETNGTSDTVSVYEHDDGTATVYLYQGHRVVPMRSHASASELAELKSAIDQP